MCIKGVPGLLIKTSVTINNAEIHSLAFYNVLLSFWSFIKPSSWGQNCFKPVLWIMTKCCQTNANLISSRAKSLLLCSANGAFVVLTNCCALTLGESQNTKLLIRKSPTGLLLTLEIKKQTNISIVLLVLTKAGINHNSRRLDNHRLPWLIQVYFS